MSILLLSGRGPEYKNRSYLDRSLFDPQWDRTPAPGRPLGELSLTSLRYQNAAGAWRPLMRTKTGTIPYLVTYVLESILYDLGENHESFHLDHLWTGDAEPSTTDPEVVLLSTTWRAARKIISSAADSGGSFAAADKSFITNSALAATASDDAVLASNRRLETLKSFPSELSLLRIFWLSWNRSRAAA